jgi:hypothetical protein
MDHPPAELPDEDVTERGDVRHGNPIALMILAEWVEKRDREDPDIEHRFRLVRG